MHELACNGKIVGYRLYTGARICDISIEDYEKLGVAKPVRERDKINGVTSLIDYNGFLISEGKTQTGYLATDDLSREECLELLNKYGL